MTGNAYPEKSPPPRLRPPTVPLNFSSCTARDRKSMHKMLHNMPTFVHFCSRCGQIFPPKRDPTTDRYCFRGAAVVLHKLLSSPQTTDHTPFSVKVVALCCSARPELMRVVTVAGVPLCIHLRLCRVFKNDHFVRQRYLRTAVMPGAHK